MRLTDKQIRKRLNREEEPYHIESGLWETVRRSKSAFYESQTKELLSGAEFVYQQSRYIHKFWWVLQGGVLIALWLLLELAESGEYQRKCMGIGAPLFALLLLPELWKNRNANALEIEGTSYYSLRQIYAARMVLFAFVDFILLGSFCGVEILTGKLAVEELMIQFFLPCVVTCCICFHTLYSFRDSSQVFAMLLCILWCMLWTRFVLQEKVYRAVSMPIWIIVTVAAVLYLGYCIERGQRNCMKMWEEKVMVKNE